MTNLYAVERRLIDAWDRMTDFCPKCEHGLDKYPAWEDMARAVHELKEYHYPIERWHDDKALSESMEAKQWEEGMRGVPDLILDTMQQALHGARHLKTEWDEDMGC